MELYQIGYLGLAHRQREEEEHNARPSRNLSKLRNQEIPNLLVNGSTRERTYDFFFSIPVLRTRGDNNYLAYKYFLRARISPWSSAGEERSRKIVHVGVGTWNRGKRRDNLFAWVGSLIPRGNYLPRCPLYPRHAPTFPRGPEQCPEYRNQTFPMIRGPISAHGPIAHPRAEWLLESVTRFPSMEAQYHP